MTTITPVNPADKVMVNKMTTATVPVKRAVGMVLVNKATAPTNNHTALDNKAATIMAPVNKPTVQDNKVLTTAPVNKATDLAAMIIALVNKAPVVMGQDLPAVSPTIMVNNNNKLQVTVAATITLKVAAAALNTEKQALPMILMDPEIPMTRVMDLVNKVAGAMDLAQLTIMDLAIRAPMPVLEILVVEILMTRMAVDCKVVDDRDMEGNKVEIRVMETNVVNKAEMKGMIAIIKGCP